MFDEWLPPWMVTVCVIGVLANMFWRASRGPQKIGARTSVALLGVGVLALIFSGEQGDVPATLSGLTILASFALFLALHVADLVHGEKLWFEKRHGKK